MKKNNWIVFDQNRFCSLFSVVIFEFADWSFVFQMGTRGLKLLLLMTTLLAKSWKWGAQDEGPEDEDGSLLDAILEKVWMKINLSLVWLSFLNCAFVKAGIILWKAKGKLLVYSSSSKYCSARGPLWASYLSVLSPSFFFLAQVDFPNWRESWNSRRRFEGGATNPIRTENALAPPSTSLRHMYYAYMY